MFASKFLSAALVAFTDLLALFPMLALPFLIGGVSYEVFLATICSLPVLMLFALAVSLLGSVLTQDDGTAVVLAMVVGGVLCVLTPGIYLATHLRIIADNAPPADRCGLGPTGGAALAVSAAFASGCRAGGGDAPGGTGRAEMEWPGPGGLFREFREIVREPLPDPSDPRFKKWDVRERFPWGWEMVQHQLHERLARRQGH